MHNDTAYLQAYICPEPLRCNERGRPESRVGVVSEAISPGDMVRTLSKEHPAWVAILGADEVEHVVEPSNQGPE